ncbi:MAG: hypothetical protein GX938_09475 [Spirochaetales bacterium]|nr:hypothetical protein [Spirochaetales bacterium]
MREKIIIPSRARYIWCGDRAKRDNHILFVKSFFIDDLNALSDRLPAYIAAETKYWLYLNEKLIVFEGGLFRESLPGCGYADLLDLRPFLKSGENILAVHVHYYGNQGRNNIDIGKGGFLFFCEGLGLYSDETFLSKRHDGFYHVDNSRSSHLYGGYDLGVDASSPDHDFYKISATRTEFMPSAEYDPDDYGGLCLREIPFIRLEDARTYDWHMENGTINVKLPYAMTFSPYLKLHAQGGERLCLQSDRYEVRGGPGDHKNLYRGHLMEYRCKAGLNEFQFPSYLFGEAFTLCNPDGQFDGLEILNVGAAESRYDTAQTAYFECGCPITDLLVEKSVRTLLVCMRDNFMDCPDRERGQWIGDVSVQAPQALMVLDDRARPLLRKAILDFILLRKGDILVGNVPGAHASELPGQSLNAISEFGLIAEYCKYTGEDTILSLTFEPSVRYLMLWELDEHNLLKPRAGNWRWFDHLQNIDETVLEHAFYYSALKFAKYCATLTGNSSYDCFLNTRIAVIEETFKKFWNGNCFTSGKVVDDRANAIAVLAGLADVSQYPKIRDILITVFNSSVYMENYVLWALCKMGYIQEAYRRMVSRYYNLATNENTTLCEDFYILGTKNHAWSGAPLNIAFKYLAGIDTCDGFNTYTVTPAVDLFPSMSFKFQAKKKLVKVTVRDEGVTVTEEPV